MNKMESSTFTSRLDVINMKLDSTRARTSSVLDSFFTARNKMGLFNGAVLFAEYGEIVYENAFGFADFRKKDSMKVSDAFQLASVTKPLTAAAVLMLHDKKSLSIYDNVKKYIPDFPYEGISIKLLLTHRSGLPNYMYFADKHWPSRRKTIANTDVINLMKEFKPAIYYIPDYRYNYSNTNYALLAS
ncbi:MAG: serine hydrolase, partial [Calditrichia bacterium]|nr:serine hydrolase [Calditrichia bacterium]